MSIISNEWYIPNFSDLKVFVEFSFMIANDSDDRDSLSAGRGQGEDQAVGQSAVGPSAVTESVVAGNYFSQS